MPAFYLMEPQNGNACFEVVSCCFWDTEGIEKAGFLQPALSSN
jgi:hypothetical protein